MSSRAGYGLCCSFSTSSLWSIPVQERHLLLGFSSTWSYCTFMFSSAFGYLLLTADSLSFWIPLIYGSVIYHRSRKESRTYKPVEHPLSMPQDNIVPTEYPSQYKHFVAEEQHDDVESRPGRPRRLSYNHQRDTRFESYRQERSSFSGKSVV